MVTIAEGQGTAAADAPGPRGLTLLRLLAAARRDPLGVSLGAFHRYGEVVRYPLPSPIYQLCAPELIERVLVERRDVYHKYRHTGSRMELLFGDSLLTRNGDAWRRRRDMARPAFHPRRIAALAPVVTDEAEALAERWQRLDGGVVELAEEMLGLSLRVLAKSMLGGGTGADAERAGRAFTRLSRELFRLPLGYRIARRFLPGLKPPRNREFDEGLAELEEVLGRIVAERRERLERGERLGDDLVSTLVSARDPESGERLTPRQLRDEVVTMFVGGHETTAIALTWSWYLLGRHPRVAAEVTAEVDRLGSKVPGAGDLPALELLRRVVEESMRLFPPAHSFSRSPVADDVVGGYRIPAGARVLIQPFVVHRHPGHWPDPERFDPDRFLPENAASRHPYAYLPFGGGPRICIGRRFGVQEILLVLAVLARRFELRLVDDDAPGFEPLLTLRPRGGLRVRPVLRRS